MGEKYTPSPEQIIEGNLGREFIEEAAGISKSIFEQMKVQMLEIISSQGSSSEHQEKAREYLDMWKNFSNGIYARTSSSNVKSPENLAIAIKGATALMQPEAMHDSDGDVRNMISELEKRYGKE